MNEERPPFDDLKVRQAVNYAIDSRALERIYAGQLKALHQVLPPGMPGYKPYDLYPHDMAKAEKLIEEANPSDRDITVWTDDESPQEEVGAYYQDVLKKLGFNANLKVLGDNFFTVIGNESTPDLDTGWIDWYEDYPHPNDFFEPLLAGESILPTNNTNTSRTDYPDLNAKINEARRRTARPEAGSRIRGTGQGIHGKGAVGPLRHAHAVDLRLRRRQPRQRDLQPDLRPVPDQLRIQVEKRPPAR